MPNWCMNQLIIQGEEKALDAFDEAFHGHGPLFYPNADEIDQTAKRDHLDRRGAIRLLLGKKAARQNGPACYCLNALVPVPPEVLREGFHAAQPWLKTNWGPGREIPPDEVRPERAAGSLTYRIDSAWNALVPWVCHLVQDFPHLTFSLAYAEPSNCFAGFLEGAGGYVTAEEYVDTADEVNDLAQKYLGFSVY